MAIGISERLRNSVQKLRDSTTLDEKAGSFFRNTLKPMGSTVGQVGTSAIKSFYNTNKGLGSGLGTAIMMPFENRRLAREQETAQLMADLGARRQARGLDSSPYYKSAQNLSQNIANQQQTLGERGQQARRDAISGAWNNALTVIGGSGSAKALLGYSALGGTIGGATSFLDPDQTFAEGVGSGIGSSLKYKALGQMVSPHATVLAEGLLPAGSNVLSRIAARQVAAGLGNVAEDQIDTRIAQGRAPTFSENAFSFLMGAAGEAFSQATSLKNGQLPAATSSLFEIVPDTGKIKLSKQARDGIGRFAKEIGASAREAQKQAVRFVDWYNEPIPVGKMKVRLSDGTVKMVDKYVPRGRAGFVKLGPDSLSKQRNVGDMTNRAQIQKNLSQALKNGSSKPVHFGSLSDTRFNQINKLLVESGQKPLANKDLYIHPAVIKKLQNKRISLENLTPDQVADIAFSAIHNTKSRVANTRFPQNKAVFKVKGNNANTAYIGNFKGDGSIKSAYIKDLDAISKDIKGDGRTSPSGITTDVANLTPRTAFSGAQNIDPSIPQKGVTPQGATKRPTLGQQQVPTFSSNQRTPENNVPGRQVGAQTQIPRQSGQLSGSGMQPPKPPTNSSSLKSNVSETGGVINSIKTKMNKFYTQAVDRFHPLSSVAKQAGEGQAMQNALTGHYGSGSTANYHIDYELAPILREQNVGNLRKAAIAMRDVELANRGIKGSKQQKQALEDLKSLEKELGPEQMKSLGNTLKKLYSYQDKMVKDYLVKNGIISEAAYSAMRKNNQFYVPYKRVMDKVDEFLGFTPQTKGAGSVSSQDVVKGIKGSDRDIFDPIESIVENTYKMVGLGKRQEVARTIVSLKDKLPEGMIQKLSKGAKHSPAETISLFENGKVVHYRVPSEVAESARGLSEEQLSTLIKILQAPTSVFRATATGINPEFMLPNVARDLQSAVVNAGLNPLKWVKGVAHLAKQDQVYQDFLKAGGKTSRISIDRPMLKKTVSEITNPQGVSIKKPSDFLKILQTLGEYSEQPTRIAVFEDTLNKSLKQGMNKEDALKKAAYMAQEGTVNFGRRGSKTQSANAIYAFMNARLQGTDRLIRSVKKDPVGASIRLGMVSVGPALALRAWNKQFESYNDERILSERDKKDNFIFMLSDKPISSLGGAQYVKIPKGDVGKLANPVEAFLDYAEGRGGNVASALGETLKSFLPIDEPGGLIPTAVKPVVETAVNKNFYTGYDIVPDYKKNYPAGYQDSAYTSPLFRMIGQKTNVSPAKLQHLAEGYGTGLMRIGEMATQPFISNQYTTPQNQRGADVNRTPITRRFLGGAKMSEEEQLKSNASKYKAITNEIGRIRNASERGEIPVSAAEEQIRKLQGQLPSLSGKTSSTNTNLTDEDVDLIRLRMKTGNLPSTYQQGNYFFYTRPSDSSIQKIEIDKKVLFPKLSGSKDIDTKLLSQYKTALTSKENDIVTLYQNGYYTLEQAEKQIKDINTIRDFLKSASGSGKKMVTDSELLTAYRRALKAQMGLSDAPKQSPSIASSYGRSLQERARNFKSVI